MGAEVILFRRIKTVWTEQGWAWMVLTIGLLIVTALTAISGVWHHRYELAHQKDPTTGYVTKTATTKPIQIVSNQTVLGQSTSHPQSTTPAPKSPSPPSGPPKSTPASAPPSIASSQPATTISASLTINDSSKGHITLPANSNQCDVLTQALKNGQLSSLDMRYSSQYGTYAVYVIDGIGDSNSVWWTYKVNGKSPPYGCSQQPVHDGDAVTWRYVKE